MSIHGEGVAIYSMFYLIYVKVTNSIFEFPKKLISFSKMKEYWIGRFVGRLNFVFHFSMFVAY